MKKFVFFCLLTLTINVYGQTILWKKIFKDNTQSVTLQVKTSDNHYVFVGTASNVFGSSSSDVYLQKIDLNGNLLWKTHLGGNLSDIETDLLADESGGVFIVSKSTSSSDLFNVHYGSIWDGPAPNYDLWITHINSSGNIMWNKHIGGSGNETDAKMIRYNSGFLLGVNTTSKDYDFTNSANSQDDVWIMNFSADGDIIWKTRILGNDIDKLAKLKILDNEICLLVNSRSSDGDFSGTNTTNSNIGYILKLNSSGTVYSSLPLISSSFNYPKNTFITDAVYGNGNLVVLGLKAEDQNGKSVVTVLYNQNGDLQWERKIPDATIPKAIFYQNNQILVYSHAIPALSTFLFTSVYDENGNVLKHSYQQNSNFSKAVMLPNNSVCLANYGIGDFSGHPKYYLLSLFNSSYNFISGKSLASGIQSDGIMPITLINDNEILVSFQYGKLFTDPEIGTHIFRISLDGLLSVKDQEDAATIKVFPNPTKNGIYLTKKAEQLFLYTVEGRLINSFKNTENIDVHYLPNGVYFLKAIFSDEVKTFKFIKE